MHDSNYFYSIIYKKYLSNVSGAPDLLILLTQQALKWYSWLKKIVFCVIFGKSQKVVPFAPPSPNNSLDSFFVRVIDPT